MKALRIFGRYEKRFIQVALLFAVVGATLFYLNVGTLAIISLAIVTAVSTPVVICAWLSAGR